MTIEELCPTYADEAFAEAMTHDDDCDCELCVSLALAFQPEER